MTHEEKQCGKTLTDHKFQYDEKTFLSLSIQQLRQI